MLNDASTYILELKFILICELSKIFHILKTFLNFK